jgi:hypothetical protein
MRTRATDASIQAKPKADAARYWQHHPRVGVVVCDDDVGRSRSTQLIVPSSTRKNPVHSPAPRFTIAARMTLDEGPRLLIEDLGADGHSRMRRPVFADG